MMNNQRCSVNTLISHAMDRYGYTSGYPTQQSLQLSTVMLHAVRTRPSVEGALLEVPR